MEFRLLGPVEAVIAGNPVSIAANRQKIVLTVLLLEAGHVVPVARLIDAMWGCEPPRTARSQVQITISALRQLLGDDVIVTRPPGYLIQLPPDALDLARFESEVAAAAIADAPAEAVRQLRHALSLWRGNAAAGVEGAIVEAAAIRLNERRIAVLQDCLDLELQLGGHSRVVGELAELVAEHPLNERFRGQFVLALYRSGRQADALGVLRAGRRILRDELGLDPGEGLRRLERAILTNDPQLNLAAARRQANTPPKGLGVPLPRQLPRTISDFAGREYHLGEISRLLSREGCEGRPHDVPVAMLTGRGGTGKTTLAVRAAHLLRGEFPDGQLFIQIRPDVRQSTSGLLEHLLRTLGIPADTVPADLDSREAMYRSWLADRRVLIVIDGAVTASQVRHLLPGVGGCAVIVTSIQRLALDDAYVISVGPLDDAAARQLLTELIGAKRAEAECAAVSELVRLCEGLPLALRIVGGKLAERQHWRVARMVEQLRDEGRRLDELDLGSASVRATLAICYASLSEDARRLFRVLSALGTCDFASWVCAPLLDSDIDQAEDLLHQLVQSHLVETTVLADDSIRYHLHDMVRIYALERLAGEETSESRVGSVGRLLRCWLFLATSAHRRIYGGDYGILHGSAELWQLPAGAVAVLLDDPAAWFRNERTSLIAAIFQACQLNLDELCWDLASSSATLFESGFYSADWRESHTSALDVVRRAGNKRGEAALHCSLGMLELSVRLERACEHFRTALAIFREISDPQGTALAVAGLAFVSRMRGDYKEALETYAEALTGFRAVGDLASQAHTLKTMAQIYADWVDYDQAELLLQDAAAICEDLHSPRLTAQVEHQAAELYLRKGQLERAVHAFRSVLDLTRSSSDVIGQMYALAGLGDSLRRRGDLVNAESALGKALELAGDMDERLIRGRLLLALAELDHAQDRADLALARIDEAIGVLEELGGAQIWQARALELLGRLHAEAGRGTIAEHAWRTAVEMAGAADPRLTERLALSLARLRADD